jgi:hypothetical protein
MILSDAMVNILIFIQIGSGIQRLMREGGGFIYIYIYIHTHTQRKVISEAYFHVSK